MQKIYEKTLLYDFYGELLTPRQREIYEAVVFNDISLAEAASIYSVSRQGIHDMLKRIDKTLDEYEEKLRMVDSFEKIRAEVLTLQKKASDAVSLPEFVNDVRKSTKKLLKELEA